MRSVLLAAAAAIVLADARPAPAPVAEPVPPGGLLVWVVDGMTRVGLREAPGPHRTAGVSAARGEFEPFQVVVRAPAGGLHAVDVRVSDLAGPGGAVIPATAMELYLERYVHVPRSSNTFRHGLQPLPPGWFADGLVPFVRPDGTPNTTRVPFDVPGGQNQPVWVDLAVPRGRARCPPGAYSGTLTVEAREGRASIPVSVTVWDFELPSRPSLRSAFGVNSRRMDDLRQVELLVSHKLLPQVLSPSQVRALGVDRVPLTGLPFFSHAGSVLDASTGATGMDPPPALDAVRRSVARFPPGVELYEYVSDESDRYFAIYPTIRAWARVFHAAGVKTLITVPPQPLLLHENEDGTGRSAVDIWVMLPVQMKPDDPSYRRAVAAGHEIWSYNTMVQDDFSPKWHIDALPVGFRLQPGFISQSLGLTGVLYWTVDRWANADYWADPYFHDGADRYAGDGTLIYPPRTPSFDTGMGTRQSGVPSMRLKWLREGVEDYEYVQLLKAAGRGDLALEIARGVGADWRRWSRDATAVQRARDRLGAELHRLATEAAARRAP